MATFRDKLMNTLTDSIYDKNKLEDANVNFTKMVFKQQNKLRNNPNINIRKFSSNNYFPKKKNNIIFEYNLTINQSKINKQNLRSNKSSNNINQKKFSKIFKKENSINNINVLIRSLTLNDIHNNEGLNLNKSLSQIDIEDTERFNLGMKKKIQKMKTIIGFDEEDSNIRNINNKPPRNLNNNLCKFNKKEYYHISPSSRFNYNMKKKYFNNKFIVKDWNPKFKQVNSDIENINNENDYIFIIREKNNNKNLMKKNEKNHSLILDL